MDATKEATMRVAGSTPLGPIQLWTFLAYMADRYVTNIVATLARTTTVITAQVCWIPGYTGQKKAVVICCFRFFGIGRTPSFQGDR